VRQKGVVPSWGTCKLPTGEGIVDANIEEEVRHQTNSRSRSATAKKKGVVPGWGTCKLPT
jgi:hypothetical protein